MTHIPVEERVGDLEDAEKAHSAELTALRTELDFVKRHFLDMAERFDLLTKEVSFVRRRLAQWHPEVHNCRKCGAAVHASAVSCRCGAKWGTPKDDSKTGLPI